MLTESQYSRGNLQQMSSIVENICCRYCDPNLEDYKCICYLPATIYTRNYSVVTKTFDLS